MDENDIIVEKQHRPFILSILCFIVFVYSSVFFTLFTFSAIFYHWISFILHDFLPDIQIDKLTILLVSVIGMVLYAGSFLGAFFIWKLKRAGYFIYLMASLITAILPFFFDMGNPISPITFAILIFTLSFYLRILK